MHRVDVLRSSTRRNVNYVRFIVSLGASGLRAQGSFPLAGGDVSIFWCNNSI